MMGFLRNTNTALTYRYSPTYESNIKQFVTMNSIFFHAFFNGLLLNVYFNLFLYIMLMQCPYSYFVV